MCIKLFLGWIEISVLQFLRTKYCVCLFVCLFYSVTMFDLLYIGYNTYLDL